MHKVSRSHFYDYKRSFQQFGIEGLVDKPPIPASHPNEVPERVKDQVIELSLEHPAFGQQRIADQLALEEINICPTTVRNIWLKAGMEIKYKRLLKLDEFLAEEKIELTVDQIKLLEKASPKFKERNVESDYSG